VFAIELGRWRYVLERSYDSDAFVIDSVDPQELATKEQPVARSHLRARDSQAIDHGPFLAWISGGRDRPVVIGDLG
jgi:hypothetical protein